MNQDQFQCLYLDDWMILAFFSAGSKYFCFLMYFFLSIIAKNVHSHRLILFFFFFQHSICKLILNWQCSWSQKDNRRCAFRIIAQRPAVAKESMLPLFWYSSPLALDWIWQGHLTLLSRGALSSPPWLSNQRSSIRNGDVLEEVIKWVPDIIDPVVFSTHLRPGPDR